MTKKEKMKEYKIEFEVVDRSVYYSIVEAESPQDALRLWSDDPCQYDGEVETTIESEDLIDTAECVGEWIENIEENLPFNSSSLKRYDEPIKLKQ